MGDVSASETDAALLKRIQQLLEAWETYRQPSQMRSELEQHLRAMTAMLADSTHLASLSSSTDRVDALQSLLDQAALVDERNLTTVRRAHDRIVEQSRQLREAGEAATEFEEEAAKSLTRFKEQLDAYENEKRQLNAELAKLSGLEESHRQLTEERDRLKEQLTDIAASKDEQNRDEVTTAARLANANYHIDKLNRQLEYREDDLKSVGAQLDRSSTEVAETAAKLQERQRSLDDAMQRTERLEQQLRAEEGRRRNAEQQVRAEEGRRQNAEQKADEFRERLGQTLSRLEELASRTSQAVDRARVAGRREAAQRSERPPSMWVSLTLVGALGAWLALRAVVGLTDGSWMASHLWPGRIDWTDGGLVGVLLNLQFLLLVVLIAAAFLAWATITPQAVPGAGDKASFVALVTMVSGLAVLVAIGGVARVSDGELFPQAECLRELGGTSISMGWSCDLGAAAGQRSPRAEVVAYTDDEVACRSEAAAYLGVDRSTLAELSPPLRVRLLPGLPGRPRPCVVDSSDDSHLVGFFGEPQAVDGTCYSSNYHDPNLTRVWARGAGLAPWRFRTVGSLAVPDPQQARTSPIARETLCTQRFGGELDLGGWRLVGRLQGQQVVCAVSRADGTTHIGSTIGSLADGNG